MTCARREAGARRPAPSTSADSPRRPEPRRGRFGARLFFLPALALLLGALSLFAAAPAQAQATVWSATLTVATATQVGGCETWLTACSTALTDDDFEHPTGTTRTIVGLVTYQSRLYFRLSGLTGAQAKTALSGLTLNVGSDGTTLAIDDATVSTVLDQTQGHLTWTDTVEWGSSQTIMLSLTAATQQTTAPAAPTNLSVSAGNAALFLSWTAPTGTLSGYDVHYTSAAASTVGNNVAVQTGGSATAATGWLAVSRSGTTATQTISSLTNGTPYRVRVRAKTSSASGAWVFGTGSPSARAATLAAPTNLSVSAGNAQLSLTWTAPTGTLSGYDVHYTSAAVSDNAVASGSNPAATWVAVTRNGTTASQTISSLSNGTAYRVRVRAKTSSANGAWVFGTGTPVASSTPTVTLSGPATVTEGQTATITLAISPASSSILRVGYTVAVGTAEIGDLDLTSGIGAGSVSGDFTITAGATSATFNLVQTTHDTDQDDETFTVTLNSGTGYAVGSPSSLQITINDDEPANLAVAPGNAKLDLTWTAPTGTLTGYDVHYTSAAAGTVGNNVAASGSNPAAAWVAVTRSGTTASQTISTLSNGTAYRVRVRAKTSSANSAWVFGTGTPVAQTVAAPTNLTVTPGDGRLDVSWTAVSGASYYVAAYTSSSTVAADAALRTDLNAALGWRAGVNISSGGVGTSGSITGLVNGTAYRVRVQAVVTGPPLARSAFVVGTGTPVAPPAAPTGLTVTPGDFSMTVSWTAPSGTVTGYDVHYTSAPAATVANDAAVGSGYPPEQGWLDAVHSGTGTTHNLLHLDNGTPYRVRVRAVNANGNSAWVVGSGTPVAPSTPTVTTPTVSLSASPNPVVEGSSVIVTATLSAPAASALTIPVTVTAGTAESGDFGSLTTIAIAAGETKGRGTITTSHDSGENDETFTVSLGSTLPGGLLAGSPASVTVTIADDEGNVTVSFARATATLCEGGPRKNLPGLVLSRRPVRSSAAVWVTLDRGTAEWRDHSFAGLTAISIQHTQYSWYAHPFSIQAYEDGDSAYEEFTVQIDESRMPRGFVAVSPKKVKVTIVDNDLWGQDGCDIQPARLSVKARWRGVEGSGRWIPFTVSTDRNSPGPFTVDYRTEDVTARSDGTTAAGTKDYVPASGRLTFGPDERTKEVRVFLLDDEIEDSGETFRLVLHNAQGGVIEQGVAIGTILNEEQYVDETKLRAAFERVPARSSGTEAFWFDLRFTEALGETANAPSAASFAVTGGRIDRVWKVEAGLWRLRVEPEAWREVTVTLSGGRGCDAAGAVCTADGRALVNSPVATVASPERPLSSNADLSGLSAQGAGADGRWSALDFGAFRAGKTGFYSVTVPYGTTQARLTATAAHAGAKLKAGAAGSLSAVSSGAAGPSIALDVGANALAVQVTAEDGTARTYRVTVTREAAQQESEPEPQEVVQTEEEPEQQQQQQQQQQRLDPLTASFGNVPPEHDGKSAFTIDVSFSEAPGGRAPVAGSFRVAYGSVAGVGRVSAGVYRVRVKPKSWRDVKVTLAPPSDCAATGAVCASGGRALSNTVTATVGGPVRIRVEGARAKEGRDEALNFAVTLNRAASHAVSVDYATEDGTAAAGADYTAVSGTLVFAAGETAKMVSVPVLDDAIDEGKETLRLKLTNARGAYLRSVHGQARGIIFNEDALQQAWLSRFGRMVAGDAVDAVTGRLETAGGAGSHLTLAGQRLDLSRVEDARALAEAVTGLARAFGAGEAPAAGDGPLARQGLVGAWNDPEAGAGARSMTWREMLAGTSFRAVFGSGAGSRWTSWGQGAAVSRFSGGAPELGLSGESATGSMGMDYERGRLLAGLAMTHSVGEGSARDAGWRYAMGSTATMMLPYARYALTERVSAWALAGTGSGSLALDLDRGVPQEYRTDLSMTLAAAGVRGELWSAPEPGGLALALKADAFWVRTESDKVTASEFGNLMGARGESSRVRAVLDGSRRFALPGGATLTPTVELGLRHDGGDAEQGTGVEYGAGFGYADPSLGLDVALRVHGLAVHAEEGYGEWGVSGSLKLVPGVGRRGLSASLTPAWGANPGGTERLWAAPESSGLASEGGAPPSSRLDAEVGYGMALLGERFTGTPYVGYGLSDTDREYRMGWRLSLGDGGGFEASLDAARRDNAGDAPEHRIAVGVTARW